MVSSGVLLYSTVGSTPTMGTMAVYSHARFVNVHQQGRHTVSTSIKGLVSMMVAIYRGVVQFTLYVAKVGASLLTIASAVGRLSVRAYVYAVDFMTPHAEATVRTTVDGAHMVKDGVDGTSSLIMAGAATLVERINNLLPLEEED